MTWAEAGSFARRERWHLAALLLAVAVVAGHRSAAGPAGDPWEQDRRQMAQHLEQQTTRWSPEAVRTRLAASPALAWRVGALSWLFATAVVLGGLAGWRALRRRRAGKSWLRGPWRHIPAVPWGVWDIVKVFAWLIALSQAAAFLAALVLRLGRLPWPDRYLAATVQTMVTDGLALVLVAVLIVRRYRAPVKTLGLHGPPWSRQIAAGLHGYLLWLPLFLAAGGLVMLVSRWWALEPTPQPVVVMLLQESRPRLLMALMGLVAVVGPVAEEIVFRGVVYAALRRRWGVRWGLAGSAVLFAGLHADPLAFGPILVLGLLLGWLYEQTGSLLPSMTVHVAHNSVMLITALTARDLLRLLGTGP
ncbi:MAG: hypothetical protein A3C53_05455 [Omnitrophica WOR_2 bacterium RIFCSPHIGHO2_02_FULL_68_15]|nr:MAG: hypothetical protein A3C53_05455 [Omnitrophica WOR_2 bacterium RIFCSPHIGHO2_02_FULL_68_15]